MKNERGSITLFVLVSMLFFLIIATTAYVSASTKLQGQNDEIARIKASYEQDLSDEALLQLYNKVTKTREWLAGSGTQEDTYKIYTIEDLVEFSRRSNAGEFVEEGTGEARYIYVELMNDLDFKRDSSYAKADRTDFGDVNDDGTVQDLKTELTTGQGFPCIAATETNAFTGTFMGNDHEIKNLWISNSKNDVTSIGLFGWIGNSTIENLGITGNITATVAETTGGVAGTTVSNSTCKMSNCYNKSAITGLINVAGLISKADGILEIYNCYNEGNIISTIENVTNAVSIGGIIAKASTNSINLKSCHNSGIVRSNASYTSNFIYNGGIVGVANDCIISKCYNTGMITNGNKVGGIIGLIGSNGTLKIINSYNLAEINAVILNEEHTPSSVFWARSGGICNYSEVSTIDIINCFNTGNINGYLAPAGIVSKMRNSTADIINCYNSGTLLNNRGQTNGGIISDVTSSTVNVSNAYYIDNVSTGVEGIIPDPGTQMTQSQMQASSFVDTLNANKNSINLSDYGLSDYTLSSWKQGTDGYPDFDW